MKTAEQRRKKHIRTLFMLWGTIIAIVSTLLSLVAVRQFLIAVLPLGLNLVFIIAMQVLQVVFYFGFLMYWLSGAKVEAIMPGDARSVTLDDYKGQPVVLSRAGQMVKVLEGYSRIRDIGGESPKGILLIGPPGSGKSYMAQCLAGSCQIPCLLLDSMGLVSMWLGMSSIKIMRFFARLHKLARQYGAAIGFLDEIDAIGTARGGVEGQSMAMGGGGFWGGGGMGALNTLLSRMDGLHSPPGLIGWIRKRFYGWLGMKLPKPDYAVLIMAATNRPSVLDTALTRAGRFDLQWRITAPTEDGLREIIEYYLAQVEHDPDIDPARMASVLRGAMPADVKTTILRNATMLCEIEGAKVVTERHIYQGAWEARLGLEMPHPEPHEADQKATAWHEAGHAVVMMSLFPELQALLVSIVPHAGTGRIGATLGVVVPGFREERQSLPLDFLARQLLMSMAGREATALLGRTHVGFGGDRANMQRALANMIAEGALGYKASLLVGVEQGKPFAGLSETDQGKVEELLDRAALMTQNLLEDNRETLAALADLLQTEGTLTADALELFFGRYPVKDCSEDVVGVLLEALEECDECEDETLDED